MFGTDDGSARPSILGATLKTALAVCFVSLCAATWFTSSFEPQRGPSRIAAAKTRDVADPVATGSLARSAASTSLDPCAIARPR